KVVTGNFTPQSTPSVTRIAAPEGLKILDASATGVALAWRAVRGADTYRVYRTQGSGASFKAVGDVSGPSFGDFRLAPATEYKWQVRAIKEGLEGQPSSSATGRTRDAPIGQ